MAALDEAYQAKLLGELERNQRLVQEKHDLNHTYAL